MLASRLVFIGFVHISLEKSDYTSLHSSICVNLLVAFIVKLVQSCELSVKTSVNE